VILINLLPHREATRKRRKEAFFVSLGGAGVMGLAIAGAIYLWYAAQISTQQERNEFLQVEIKKLEAQIKDIAAMQQEIAALRARQQAVEDLQADRNMPVHLLNELVHQLPDGVYLTAVKQDNQVVTLNGVAQSNERVSELLRNLGNKSPWLARPELVEIVAGNVQLGRDQRRVSNFSMRVRVLRASEAQKAAAAAASAASASASASTEAKPAAAPVAAAASAQSAQAGAQAPATVTAAGTTAGAKK
jgi:type IV pilus assembly protein PilN